MMKRMRHGFIAGAGLLRVFQCSQQAKAPTEEYPLLETMGYYQRFSDKLWRAGSQQNWELADFYTHELAEVSEDLIKNEVIYDEYDISNLSRVMLLPKIEPLEQAIRK